MRRRSRASGAHQDAERPILDLSNGERGFTLAELVVIIAVAGLALALGLMYSLDWANRAVARNSVYKVQIFMQLARVSAISRNHTCRFQVDSTTRTISVIDLNDPMDATDDTTIKTVTLSSKVSFTRPDPGSPITLTLLSGTTYGASFSSDGSVTGSGVVSILAGDRYTQVTVFGAGATKAERYDGSAWVLGS